MVVGAEGRPRRLGDARREARLESCYRDPAMHSRWDDAEARRLEGLDLLVYASRLIGAETSLVRSEEHTSELQSHSDLVCRLLLEKKKKTKKQTHTTNL